MLEAPEATAEVLREGWIDRTAPKRMAEDHLHPHAREGDLG
jgi:hypothetical protein